MLVDVTMAFNSTESHQRWLTREFSSLFKPTFYPCSFSPATPTPRGCTQLPLARYQLHCILKNGRGNERQLLCLRFLCSSRQVDCARKNRQLSDLDVLIKSLVTSPTFKWRALCWLGRTVNMYAVIVYISKKSCKTARFQGERWPNCCGFVELT